jgi:hypothetical protein
MTSKDCFVSTEETLVSLFETNYCVEINTAFTKYEVKPSRATEIREVVIK